MKENRKCEGGKEIHGKGIQKSMRIYSEFMENKDENKRRIS